MSGDVEVSFENAELSFKDAELNLETNNDTSASGSSIITVPFFMQKIVAEILATYFVIFAGRAGLVVYADKDKVVTVPGIAIIWGSVVMVMVYAVGHVSGAHFNPAVTIAFACCKIFPWKQVPAYICAQVTGATLANLTLWFLFDGRHGHHFAGIPPTGTDIQAVSMEFIITFHLMFVVAGVATDDRAIGELAGLAIGATVVLNVMFAWAISGGVMNPAGALGLAFVSGNYKGVWIYLVGPTTGGTAGCWAYNLVRVTDKQVPKITCRGSCLPKMLRSK